MGWFDLPRALRITIKASAAVNDAVEERVHYQELPAESQYPHVWFARSSRDSDSRCLDGTPEFTIERFSLEIVSDADCEAIVDGIVSELESFGGQHAGQWVEFVEVEDADDEYLFQSIGEDAPDFLHALQIAVYIVPLN